MGRKREPVATKEKAEAELYTHLSALGLASVEEYRCWCAANGFTKKLQKHANVRRREQELVSRLQTQRYLTQRGAANDKPIDCLKAICNNRFRETDLSLPHLQAFCRSIPERPKSEPTIDRAALVRSLDHLHSVRAMFFDATTVVSALGEVTGNTFLEALVAVVANEGSWLRPLESWRPRSYNARRQFASLLRHLFVEYKMPMFFDSVWFAGSSNEAAEQRSWYRRVGHGENIRHCGLPIAYTKRMSHYFMQAPVGITISQALRWGQVRGLQGDECLARAVISTRLGERFGNDEFWTTVMRWFTSHPMLDRAHVGPIIDYLHHHRHGDDETAPLQPNLSMRGRSPESLLAQVTAWHRGLANVNSKGARQWRPSGIAPFEWTEGSELNGSQRCWVVRELLDTGSLVAEGRKLRHCVSSYASSCARGYCSIWTVESATREGQKKLLTVEVRNSTRQICQARGLANRMPTQQELGVLRRWAAAARLSISCRV